MVHNLISLQKSIFKTIPQNSEQTIWSIHARLGGIVIEGEYYFFFVLLILRQFAKSEWSIPFKTQI